MEEKKPEGGAGPEPVAPIWELGDRMKEYEAANEQFLDPTLPFLVRLDGHGFAKYTRQFTKPFDERFNRAMVATATDLLVEFGAVCVYTCSDEITLVFPAARPKAGEEIEEATTEEEKKKLERRKELDPQSLLPYSGRLQKLVSLTAGCASARFNNHICAQTYDPIKEQALLAHVKGDKKFFDARVFSVRSNAEVYNNIYWRATYEYRRNNIANLAHHYITPKEIPSWAEFCGDADEAERGKEHRLERLPRLVQVGDVH